MIIKATRITTFSGADALGDHVFDGLGNDDILTIQGCREDLDDMVADAVRHGAKYSIRHVIISPSQITRRQEAIALVARYAIEFGGDASRSVIVEHRKSREHAGYNLHWHAMIPEVQDGRVLNSSWMRLRHEKLSRVAEMDLGHALVPGRWNRAVETTLRAEGHSEMAARVAPLALIPRPTSSYTGAQHQAARRAGLSMPHTRAIAMAAAQATWADSGKAFASALATQGLRLKTGAKTGIIIIEGHDGDGDWHELGAVHRMLKVDRQAVADRLAGIDFSQIFSEVHGAKAGATPLPSTTTPAAISVVGSTEEKQHVNIQFAQPCSVVGRRPETNSGRRGGDRPSSGVPAHAGSERPVSGGLRHAEGGHDDRSLATPAGFIGGARRRGDGQDRLGASPPRSDRGESGRYRGAHGRARICDQRSEIGLAHRLADRERETRLRALTIRLTPPTRNHFGVSLCTGLESNDESLERHDRWIAAALRRAYDLEWVPESVIVNIFNIEVDQARKAVILTLRSGTRIVDRRTRIDIIGQTDDVAIAEVVSAVQRRGWDAVRLHGPLAFQRAAAVQLQLLDPPVIVADSPLTEADQIKLERMRLARVQGPEGTDRTIRCR
jgi:hypothetical protein